MDVVDEFTTLDPQFMDDRDLVTDWLNDLLDLHIESESLSEELQDGVALCKLTQVLAKSARQAGVTTSVPPPPLRRFHQRCVPGSIQARDNVTSFCTWCAAYDVPAVLILSPENVSVNRHAARALVSLLLFILRKTSHFVTGSISRCSSVSSCGSYTDRVNKRRLSRGGNGLSTDLSEVMSRRRSSIFRSRSVSIESEGSMCSGGSPLRSPSSDTNDSIIKDLNLACWNINKKVSKVDTPVTSYEDTTFTMDKSQVGESQASLRRKSRVLVRSQSAGVSNGVVTTGSNHGNGLLGVTHADISKEKLTLDDMEYILLSNTQNISTRLTALYKLLAVRLLETKLASKSRSKGVKHGMQNGVKDKYLYPVLDLTPLSSPRVQGVIRAVKSFIIREVSDNRDVTFGDLHRVWHN